MKNILYIENTKKSCNYYIDTINFLRKYANIKICKDPFVSSIENKNFNADLIIIGYDITDCGENRPNIKFKNDLNLPLFIILNKEYAGLKNKLEWIKELNPKICFSVQHEVNKYEEMTRIPFKRIMWSADHSIFKKYDDIYKYDLLFQGVIRKEQTNDLRNKIYNKLISLKFPRIELNVSFYNNGKLSKKLYELSNEEYAKKMNHAKICFSTTGPADLVSPRFFEIMAGNKSMILCNRMDEKVYEDMLIDKFNCIMFEDENDFIEKFVYYISNEEERLKIVLNAYKYFMEKLTWDVQIKKMLNYL